MYELLEKLDIKSKKLKKFENQMCSLEELDGLKETEKSHKRLMQSHENIIKVFHENSENMEKVWKKFPGYPLSHRPFFGKSFRDIP